MIVDHNFGHIAGIVVLFQKKSAVLEISIHPVGSFEMVLPRQAGPSK